MTRVAIVGLGPKGLFALERLLNRASGDLEVDVYEPHPAPGAGPVYDPAQPRYLRMNYADSQIDLWPDDHRLVDDPPSYAAWRDAHGVVSEIRGYSSRADVGRYLNDGLRTLLRHVPAGVRVAVHRQRAAAVQRDGDGWSVDGRHYDEVLLATGHARVGPVVPGRLGERVEVRGFALTFVDVALALTEGRGGRFAATEHPYRLTYVGSAADVTVLPVSRSGRPMLAKPLTTTPGLDAGAPLGGVADLIDGLAGAAVRALAAGGSPAPRAAVIASRLETVAAGGRLPTDAGPAEELARSLDVATGLAQPDLPAALGHAWRALYPAIVEAFGHGGLPAGDWPAFHALAREMERIAFGPPVGNAARILALIECGRIDLTHVAGGPVAGADSVIDAVLPAPGATGPVVSALVAAGHARLAAGQRGLDVDRDGSCRAADGSVTPGLAAIGRPTEDAVIGNDTLSRTLHPLADRWAARVAAAVPVA